MAYICFAEDELTVSQMTRLSEELGCDVGEVNRQGNGFAYFLCKSELEEWERAVIKNYGLIIPE
jgi:hypothetical protein